MDTNSTNLLGGSMQERRATKIAKTKKKPMKVVYISNPMKFKASTASEFRALVQELTGQDSELPDPTRFVDSDDPDHVGGNYQTVPNASETVDDDVDVHHTLEVPTKDPSEEQPEKPDVPIFESFGDTLMPQILENFSGFMPPNLWYEAANVDAARGLTM